MSGPDTTFMMIAFGASWAVHVLEMLALVGVAVIVGLRGRRIAWWWLGVPATLLLVLSIGGPLLSQTAITLASRSLATSEMLLVNGAVTLASSILHAGAWAGLLVGLLKVLGDAPDGGSEPPD